MIGLSKRWGAMLAALGVVAALAGCERQAPPPDPVVMADAPTAAAPENQPVELAGGPYRPGPGAAMQPIPNPEDMDPATRARFYPKHPRSWNPSARPVIVIRRDDGTSVVTMAPIPNPDQLSPADRARIYGRHGSSTAAAHARRHAAPVYAPSHAAAAPSPAQAQAPKQVYVPSPAPTPAPAAKAAPAQSALPGPAPSLAPEPNPLPPVTQTDAGPARKSFKLPAFRLPDLGHVDWHMPRLSRMNLDAFSMPGMPKISLPGMVRATGGVIGALFLLVIALAALMIVGKRAAKRRVRAAAKRHHGGLFGGGHAEPHHA